MDFYTTPRLPRDLSVDDPSDPQALVHFALLLFSKQDYAGAAQVLLEAADLPRAESKNQTFRIAALSAAASAFLYAGDAAAFVRTVVRLRATMDRFQQATLSPQTAALLGIAAKRSGGRAGGYQILPAPVRYLFDD